jgi:WD40 repeat protein
LLSTQQIENLQPIWRVTHSGAVNSIAFGPRGQFFASAGLNGSIRLWTLGSGFTEIKAQIKAHKGQVMSVTFNATGKRLASGGLDGRVAVWDVDTWQPIFQIADIGGVYSIALGANGRYVAAAVANKVLMWEVETGREVRQWVGVGINYGLAFSPTAPILAAAGSDKVAYLWDYRDQTLISRLTGHTGPIRSLAFSPGGHTLATGGTDGHIRLWDVSTGKLLNRLVGHTDTVNGLSFSPDGLLMLSGAEDRTLRLWNVSLGTQLHRLWHSANVRAVAFGPNQELIASSDANGAIIFWGISPSALTLPVSDSAKLCAFPLRRINVREGPSERSGILTIVTLNTPLIIEDTQSRWYAVTLPDGQQGWVLSELIRLSVCD